MSHDRGCYKCHEDPPYTNCTVADCPKRAPLAERRACCDNPKYEIVNGLTTCTCERPGCPRRVRTTTRIMPQPARPVCHACQREQPEWTNCFRYAKDCPVRAAYAPNRPDTNIISVSEPGYEIVMFFNADGGAQAIISRPGGKEPIDFQIAPPLPNRRIVVERKGDAFNVVYRDAP